MVVDECGACETVPPVAHARSSGVLGNARVHPP